MVPQGETVTLPAGSYGYITQALGGSYTVFVEGNLFRIAGKDGDAMGKEPPAPLELPADASDEEVENWSGSSCGPASTPRSRSTSSTWAWSTKWSSSTWTMASARSTSR